MKGYGFKILKRKEGLQCYLKGFYKNNSLWGYQATSDEKTTDISVSVEPDEVTEFVLNEDTSNSDNNINFIESEMDPQVLLQRRQ